MPDTPPPDASRLDIDSPALERFLGSAMARYYTNPGERRRRIRALFGAPQAAERAPEPAPEELHPYRIMALWRIARLSMTVKGRLSDDERLEDATHFEPSPWEHPTRPVVREAPRRGDGKLLAMHLEGEGLPIICPQRPRTDAERALVERWCDAAGVAAGLLGVGGTERGELGLRGLLDPEVAPSCCPTADQVLAFEDQLISEAVELLVEHGEPAVAQHYRTMYGLNRREALTVIRLARVRIKEDMSIPIEEARGILLARYERFLADIGQTPNMRDRLLALKEVARITGVTREAPEDALKDFMSVIKKVSEKRDTMSAGPQRPALPAGRDRSDTSDAAFEVIDDDEEALDAFDREN